MVWTTIQHVKMGIKNVHELAKAHANSKNKTMGKIITFYQCHLLNLIIAICYIYCCHNNHWENNTHCHAKPFTYICKTFKLKLHLKEDLQELKQDELYWAKCHWVYLNLDYALPIRAYKISESNIPLSKIPMLCLYNAQRKVCVEISKVSSKFLPPFFIRDSNKKSSDVTFD